jgi:hypothetical protein
LSPPAATAASMENLRRIKSTVFSANFLRFDDLANTCDSLPLATQAPDCEHNRNGDESGYGVA